jgi:hypothetical protein
MKLLHAFYFYHSHVLVTPVDHLQGVPQYQRQDYIRSHIKYYKALALLAFILWNILKMVTRVNKTRRC